ncbi:hypothetical protein CGRA01v4_14772 [Colletotrichum graminicola]|nr:hypothetical protein CGRA01v4_14772 [Colletotrichum graminicola]
MYSHQLLNSFITTGAKKLFRIDLHATFVFVKAISENGRPENADPIASQGCLELLIAFLLELLLQPLQPIPRNPGLHQRNRTTAAAGTRQLGPTYAFMVN